MDKSEVIRIPGPMVKKVKAALAEYQEKREALERQAREFAASNVQITVEVVQ